MSTVVNQEKNAPKSHLKKSWRNHEKTSTLRPALFNLSPIAYLLRFSPQTLRRSGSPNPGIRRGETSIILALCKPVCQINQKNSIDWNGWQKGFSSLKRIWGGVNNAF
ncbi:hypothetical protein JW992_10595 [candidate division KSB1 bacterium]|nr:hypothetical protein [candidate division KSB1 bacterium]